MKYKVHIAYVNANGTVVPAGIHESTHLDVAEARNRSIVTLHDINLDSQKPTEVDSITDRKIEYIKSSNVDINEKELAATVSTTQIKKFRINSVESEDIQALKYVGKSTATKVVDERAKSKFVSYTDLDTRVPLRLGKKWQDIVMIDFEKTIPMTVENTVQFI